MANPEASIDGFEFSVEKMGNSGTLFDLHKLNDISKDVLAKKSAEEILAFMLAWAKVYQPALANLMAEKSEMLLKVFDIDRGGDKPRKDLVNARQTFAFVSYFFEEHFTVEDDYPQECPQKDIKEIFRRYLAIYDENDDNTEWFGKVRAIAEDMGYALKPKDYKKNPEEYKGHIGHVSNVIRIAITGRASSPDLWMVQQIMGPEMVKIRIAEALGVLD